VRNKKNKRAGHKIKWYGHACFRIEGDGLSIITDPYTSEVAGLDPADEPSDVIVMSSATDRFHSHASIAPGLDIESSVSPGEERPPQAR